MRQVSSAKDGLAVFILEDDEVSAAERFERAMHVAVSLGKNGEVHKATGDALYSIASSEADAKWPFLFWRLASTLVRYRYPQIANLAIAAHHWAIKAEGTKEWLWARHCYELESRAHLANKENEKAKAALNSMYELHVKEAEETLARQHPSYMVAARHILSAIEGLRKLPDTKVRRDELHHVLLDYQKRGMSEMLGHTETIDIRNSVENSIKQVEGKTFYEGLLILAIAVRSQSISDLRKMAESALSKSISRFIFPTVIVNEKGRSVARPQQPVSAGGVESEGAIRSEMVAFSNVYRGIVANGIIEPMREKIILDHDVRLWQFSDIVMDNPFVPPGREALYARGLLAGLQGDYTVAAHLLVPQLEESIRYLLNEHGVITSSLSADGIQNEHDLNTILYEKELIKFIGADVVFDLQSLLVDHCGANLRNKLAHGLMHAGEFYAPHVPYFWALVLRLCCIPWSQRLGLKQPAENPAPSQI
jgi:hypothetical protein